MIIKINWHDLNKKIRKCAILKKHWKTFDLKKPKCLGNTIMNFIYQKSTLGTFKPSFNV